MKFELKPLDKHPDYIVSFVALWESTSEEMTEFEELIGWLDDQAIRFFVFKSFSGFTENLVLAYPHSRAETTAVQLRWG